MAQYTPHQLKYMAWELSRRRNSASDDKFTSVLSEAKVDLNPHQVEAALFAFRSPLSKGAVLADEVGLGKTIEAGLVISQNWAEKKRHILVIAPATLRKQWNIELEDKFFIPSMIMERRNFNKILNDTYSNPFDTEEAIVICSYPFARKNILHIARVDWDLVVLDEAHALRNVYRNSNKTGITLRLGLQPFKKLLLTATPLQNDIKELYGLVSIIDDGYFGSLSSFSSQYNKVALRDENTYTELRNRIIPIVHRTLRSQVQAYVKYTNRIPLVQEYFPTDDEIALAELINEYLERPKSYGIPNSQRKLITLILYKLLASSSFAIAGTLDTIIRRLEKMVSDHTVSNIDELPDEPELIDDVSEEWLDEEDEETKNEAKESELTDADIPEIKKEIEDLRIIHELALKINANSKGECLIKALELGFENMRKMNAPQKALIFTESRRTQQYLYQLLEENGYAGKILLFNGTNADPKSKEIYNEWAARYKGTSRITGSKTADKRQALVDYFREHAEIMIATEAAAEGINLQFCSLIVNYDLPWNPQRVEQRIGRCHRYGQKFDVVVVNFINKANHADQRVYELLDEKFNLFKGVFGVSDEVLGSIGNGVDFEKRILEIYRSCRTTEEIDRAFDELQSELKQDIEENLQQTSNSLFENFDEEVIEKLRLREDEDLKRLDAFNKMLWELTIGVLGSRAKVSTKERYSFYIENSPVRGVEPGVYSLDKETLFGNNYRISHPLAKWVTAQGLNGLTPTSTVVFEYTKSKRHIATIKPFIGKEGWLKLRVVRYTSLHEMEEQIVIVALDADGNLMDDDFVSRLLSLPAHVSGMPKESAPTTLEEALTTKQTELTENLEARNSELVSEEIVKIENWAEDNRKSLQQRLNDLDKEIDDKNDAFVKERNLRKKLAIQKDKDSLMERRDAAWKEYDEQRSSLKKEKNSLIAKLYELAESQMAVADEFTIKWKIE